ADYDDIDLRPQQIADQRGYRVDIITIMAKLVSDVAPFDIAEVAHPAHEFLAEWIVVRGSRPDVPDTPRLARLLRARRERPRSRAAEKRDELAPSHVGHGDSSPAAASLTQNDVRFLGADLNRSESRSSRRSLRRLLQAARNRLWEFLWLPNCAPEVLIHA